MQDLGYFELMVEFNVAAMTAMGMYITMLGDHFWDSVVKTLRADDEAIKLVKQRHDMMLMPWADTATLLREVLMCLRE